MGEPSIMSVVDNGKEKTTITQKQTENICSSITTTGDSGASQILLVLIHLKR